MKDLEGMLKRLKQKIDKVDKRIQQNNGINCGWNSKDHSLFVKLVNKNQELEFGDDFISDLVVLVPQISVDEIQEHIESYKKWKALEKEKKACLQNYKDVKVQIQKKNIELVNKEEEKQNKLRIEKQKEKQSKKIDSEKVKQQIGQWKVKRQTIKELN